MSARCEPPAKWRDHRWHVLTKNGRQIRAFWIKRRWWLFGESLSFGPIDLPFAGITYLRPLGSNEEAPGTVDAKDKRIAELTEALEDMLAGWRYIRAEHGDLYGVGWHRCESAARDALAHPKGAKA